MSLFLPQIAISNPLRSYSPLTSITSNSPPLFTIRKPYISKSLSIRVFCSSMPPARDRVIDFGKHKGRMLGSLPSSYLKWISANLRARDFEDWAKLADQVLTDPVYQDRLEWELAQKALNGDVLNSSSSGVASLLEISERFGWDNEDKLGWSKLNFELLGTSNGSRIPRTRDNAAKIRDLKDEEGEEAIGTEMESGERRGDRRERLKLKRRGIKTATTNQRSRTGIERDELKMISGELLKRNSGLHNRFPGREGLLKRVMDKGNRPSL